MRFIKYFLLAILMILVISGCGQVISDENEGTVDEATPSDSMQSSEEVLPEERVVKMTTNKGDITIKLFPQYAPLAVENFITHSETGYYEGVIFHRVIEDFMIQGGDPDGTGMGGESTYGGSFEDEFSPSLSHLRGALSMANRGPNTNGSQFFIIDAEAGTPHLDGVHTVFGHVIEGMDVVDAIAEVEVGPGDRPIDEIVIESIEIIQ
ncbi:peptidylprolyl isomerase [Bacillaceae bacterium IKA-2]|jgi:peptidyl-prolyl cis-trans isomerase B (cyclophilin B)|nr:peptidylprolyl isomerase [Bacillaceae bacterium IKA-2]